MTTFKDSYIQLTNPSPYHEIFVLSQKIINAGFRRLHKVADEDSPLKYVESIKYDDSTRLDDLTLGPPVIYIRAAEASESLIWYQWDIISGTATLSKTDDTAIKVQIKNWSIILAANIVTKEIDASDPKYAKCKERSGLSDFNLTQLSIKLTEQPRFLDLDAFENQKEFSGLSEFDRGRIANEFWWFLDSYLGEVDRHGSNVLAYSLQAKSKEWDTHAPTFPPTSINYQAYPWLDLGKAKPRDSTPKSNIDQNGLVYLMTVSFSDPLTIAMPYSGAFVDGSGGCFCLTNELFWGWFKAIMVDAVKSMLILPSNGMNVVWNGTHFRPTWSVDIGVKDKTYYYTFEEVPGNGQSGLSGGDAVYELTLTNYSDEGEKKHVPPVSPLIKGVRCDQGSKWMTMSESCEIVVGRIIRRTSGRIELGLKTSFMLFTEQNDTIYSKINVIMDYNVSFGLESIDEGGLVIKKTDSKLEFSHTQWGQGDWTGSSEDVAAKLEKDVKDITEPQMVKIEEKLMQALAKQDRLFLPGAGSFLMKDPCFNYRGDLMATLQYNGL